MFESAAGFITYTLLGLSKGGRMADSLAFFMADSAKILFILFAMISAIGFARSYISLSKIKSKTADRSPFLSAVAASMFGAVTPFCSCSSVPIFLSFIKGGVPLGTAFAFLITSPLVNEYLVVLMIGAFGFKVALAYVLLGMGLGIAAGMAIGTLNLDSQIEQDFMKSARMEGDLAFPDFTSRVKYGIDEALGIVRKIWLWVLAGVGIGALIHNYVPDAVIQSVAGAGGIFSVPLAVLLGAPIYGSCAAIVPIGAALFSKGVPLGTTLAFLMAVAAISLPEAIILRRAMKLKLLAVFFGTVVAGIIVCGYLLNAMSAFLMA